MAQNNVLGSITDSIKDQLEDKVDPSKVFSEGNLKKKRGAFLTCLIAALLLMLLAMAGSLAYNVTKVSLLKEAVNQSIVVQGLVSQSDADAFVNDTMDYLTGVKTVWEPAITIGDHRVAVPDAFKTHMATVKGWVDSAKAILLAVAAIILLLLWRSLVGTKGSKKSPFSVGGYYLGAGIPLVLALGIGVWGYLDFNGLWAWVHTTFIPDGIFAAGEEIMKLFPLTLFEHYLAPVGTTFSILAGIVLVLPLILVPLSLLLTALLGKHGSTSASSSKRKTTRKTTTARKSTKKAAD